MCGPAAPLRAPPHKVRVLLTGGGGFVGGHIRAALASRGHDVVAIASSSSVDRRASDLTDAAVAEDAIGVERPDVIIHLAARAAAVSAPWNEIFENNTRSTYNVLRATQRWSPKAKLVLASSSAVYGAVPRECNPVTERQPLAPTTVYGASKAAAEALAWPFVADGLRVVIARAFNTVGPGGDRRSALAHWIAQLRAMRRDDGDATLRCGPLDTARDLTDVRDVARAYVMLAESSSNLPHVMNICSGVAVTGRELMHLLLSVAAMHPTIASSPGGAGDILYQRGDNSRIGDAVGWSPQISLEQTVRDAFTQCM